MENYAIEYDKQLFILENTNFNEALEYAKELIKEVNTRKVKIYNVMKDTIMYPATIIITNKDIQPKKTEAQNLTNYELIILKQLIDEYIRIGVENCDYYNVYEINDKKIKGALGSLTRKQVIYKNNCPDCFNPIFPYNTFKATCEKYNIDINNKEILKYIK